MIEFFIKNVEFSILSGKNTLSKWINLKKENVHRMKAIYLYDDRIDHISISNCI